MQTIGIGKGKGPGKLSHPTSVAVSGLGDVFVADTLNYRIQVFTKDGYPVCEMGGGKGSQQGQFEGVSGLAVSTPNNALLAVDFRLNRVQAFRLPKFSRHCSLRWGYPPTEAARAVSEAAVAQPAPADAKADTYGLVTSGLAFGRAPVDRRDPDAAADAKFVEFDWTKSLRGASGKTAPPSPRAATQSVTYSLCDSASGGRLSPRSSPAPTPVFGIDTLRSAVESMSKGRGDAATPPLPPDSVKLSPRAHKVPLSPRTQLREAPSAVTSVTASDAASTVISAPRLSSARSKSSTSARKPKPRGLSTDPHPSAFTKGRVSNLALLSGVCLYGGNVCVRVCVLC